MFFQFRTTNIKSLNYQSPTEKDISLSRINEYPPIYIYFGNHKLYLPVAHNLEEREQLIVLNSIQKNFFNTISLNTYFFAGHPFEGNLVQHFEHFPFIYLSIFLIGFFITKWFKNIILLISFIIPLLLLTIIGNDNTLGTISIFPFMIVLMTNGTLKLLSRFKN